MCRRPPRRRDPDVRAPPRFYSGSPRSPDRAAWCSRRLEPATYSCIVSRPDSGPSRASRSRHHLLYATPSAAASSRRPRLDLTAARRGGEREHGTGRAAQHHRHGGDSEAEPHPVQRGAEYKGVGSVRKPGRFSHRAPPPRRRLTTVPAPYLAGRTSCGGRPISPACTKFRDPLRGGRCGRLWSVGSSDP